MFCVRFVIPETDWSVTALFWGFEQWHYHEFECDNFNRFAVFDSKEFDLSKDFNVTNIYPWKWKFPSSARYYSSSNSNLTNKWVYIRFIMSRMRTFLISTFPPSSTKEKCNAYNNNKNDDFRTQAFLALRSWLLTHLHYKNEYARKLHVRCVFLCTTDAIASLFRIP